MPISEGKVLMENLSRVAQAQVLAALGFPLPLAYYALEKHNDNGNAAAEWLITEGISHTEKNPDVDWLGD